MEIVEFSYSGRFGHFLRAESTVNAMTYPVPPRTAILGLIGAVMGFQKDTLSSRIADAQVAVSGPVPETYWHKANMRKNIPSLLNQKIKKTEKGSRKDEKNTRIPQEFLLKPTYQISVSLQDELHGEFCERIKSRRWHFSPCLGLSEHLADLTWVACFKAKQLKSGIHCINSVLTASSVRLQTAQIRDERLVMQRLRMSQSVTEDRVFSHSNYFLERSGKPIPVETDQAWEIGDRKVLFL